MTKTELQVALAAATETNKRTAGVFFESLAALAYKEIKKNGEFVLPGFGKLVKQKRKARVGFNPKNATKDQDPSQDRRQIPSRQSRKGRNSGGEEVSHRQPYSVDGNSRSSETFLLRCVHACRLPESPHLANHDTDSCKGYSD
jgi:nucleoid DNA-binding protein